MCLKIWQKNFIVIVFLLFLTFGISDVFSSVLWLDELDISKVTAGWSTAKTNKSIEGKTLTIGGIEFQRGIGTHADSELNIMLDGKAVKFFAYIGIDSETNGKGSVIFELVGDNKLLASSGRCDANDSPKILKADLEGVKHLRVIAVGTSDGISYDHADWAMAKIEYSGVAPVAIDLIKPERYILTPKPGPKPRITGPKVFGVRTGNPILFTLTATGERPLSFSIKGLPEGLKLDSKTGRITGIVKEKGEYVTSVVVNNNKGMDTRSFKIVVGDKICLTPPMGWNSWNCWACAVDDQKVRDAAKAMVDSGLSNHGWSYINIDDCWMRKPGSDDPGIGEPVRNEDGRILCNDKFPDMLALTDYIHDLGLKAGIYIGPGPTTCQNYEASWEHELLDAQQFVDWGFDYLKYDWCGYSSVSGNESLEDLQRPYILMGEILRDIGRDIVYSLCQYGWGDVWKWGDTVHGQCWRTTEDIFDSWSSMAGIGFNQGDLYKYAGPGNWNDPDMLVIGKVGWGPDLHDSKLTPDEQYTHISLWCLLSAPLLIGCPIDQMDDFTLNLLTNDEVLAVNQDPLGKQAMRVKKTDDIQIWLKEMEDGSKVVGIFNMNAYKKASCEVNWEMLGLQGKRINIRDLWRQKDLGVFELSFRANDINPHGVLLFQLSGS